MLFMDKLKFNGNDTGNLVLQRSSVCDLVFMS